MDKRLFLTLCLAILGMLLSSPSTSQAIVVYSHNFDDGLAPGFSGYVKLEDVPEAVKNQSGGEIAGKLLRNDTSGHPAPATVLTLTGLPAHTHLNLSFIFLAIDTWESYSGWYGPDYLRVKVDGITIFEHSFTNYQEDLQPQTYVPAAGVQIWDWVDPNKHTAPTLGWYAACGEMGYRLGLDPAFQNIPHTASSVTISWEADCWWLSSWGKYYGFQGGWDESWAIDNVQVAVVVPVPGAALLLATGLLTLVGCRKLG